MALRKQNVFKFADILIDIILCINQAMSSSLEIGTVRNFRLSNIGSVYYFYNLKTPCTNKMENNNQQ